MKIWIDGIVRDMTQEEETALINETAGLPEIPKEEEEKIMLEAFKILMGVSE